MVRGIDEMDRQCGWCGNREASHRCGWCRTASYCGRCCQASHWTEHRLQCSFPSSIAVDVAADHEGSVRPTASGNALGLSVLATIDGQNQSGGIDRAHNVLVSPLSISVALAMIAEAAVGATRRELDRWVDVSASGIDADLFPPGAGGMANSAWLLHQPAKEYEAVLRTKYRADVFSHISVAEVNAWISKNTSGMIRQMIDSTDGATALLINAVWFSCLWMEPFVSQRTKENDVFYGPRGERPCATMCRTSRQRYAALPDGSAVGAFLPLSKTGGGSKNAGGGDESAVRERSRLEVFVAVDPRSRSAQPPSPATISSLLENERDGLVDLRLPRTKLELPPTKLLPILETLGITQLTTPHGEFPGFGDADDVVGNILHAAKLEFDERGAKGAAATIVTTKLMAMPGKRTEPERIEVVCDHPFFVGVLDTVTNALIMAGYVYEPEPTLSGTPVGTVDRSVFRSSIL